MRGEDVAANLGLSMNKSEPEWQPIETAPKDREILVADARTADGFMQVVEWEHEAKGDWKWAVKDGGRHHVNCFTHWADLPKPPADLAGSHKAPETA